MSLPGSASTDTPPASPNISTIQVSPERSNSLQLPLDTSEVTPPSSPGETSTQTSPNGDDSNSRVQSPTDKKRDASPNDSTSATSSPASKSSLFSTARSQHRDKTHNNIVLKNYEGEKNDEGLPHGFGKIDYVDGSYYEGEWQNGYRHGKGKNISQYLHSLRTNINCHKKELGLTQIVINMLVIGLMDTNMAMAFGR